MKNPVYLFGLGTGRCGTVSLSKLLNSQKNSFVTHEAKPWLPWEPDLGGICKKVATFIVRASDYGFDIVGDVALFNLQSVEALLGLLPGAKFIVLKRNKKDTIDSFKRKWKPKYNRIALKRTEWDYVFPCYQMPLGEAVNKYYEEYYNKVLELEKSYPKNVKCFSTQMLNSRFGVKSILDFCGIPKENRVIKVNIKENKGNKV